MKKLALSLVLLLIASAASAAPLARNVVIISMDGFRPDIINKERTPVLAGLLHTGAYTLKASTTLPPVTLPSHTSMLTGVGPEVHGVTWNSEKPKGTLKVPTILDLAAKLGWKTAAIAAKVRFLQILDTKATEWLHPGYTSGAVAKATVSYLAQKHPRVLFVHLTDTDETGHKDGWMTAPYFEAAGRTDAAVGQVLDAIDRAGTKADTLVIITADHGGKGKSHGAEIPEDILIPWIALGPGVRAGHVVDAKVMTYDTAATAMWALGMKAPAYVTGKPVVEAFDSRR